MTEHQKSAELTRLVVLLTPEQRDHIDSQVDRLTSRSGYVRRLVDAAIADCNHKEASK